MSQLARARGPVGTTHTWRLSLNKLVVVGEMNPLSADPALALWTQPPGCSGSRLWQMANARTDISETEWLEMTDRRNLCTGRWDPAVATASALAMAPELRDRTVILLGSYVYAKFRRIEDKMMDRSSGGVAWWSTRDWVNIPHPSGLNRWYNDVVCRASVEILLADLIHDYREANRGDRE